MTVDAKPQFQFNGRHGRHVLIDYARWAETLKGTAAHGRSKIHRPVSCAPRCWQE